jgi:hypothetical protein
MSIIIELEETGPIEIRINGVDTVSTVIRAILPLLNNSFPVNSYNKREEKNMQKLLDSIE